MLGSVPLNPIESALMPPVPATSNVYGEMTPMYAEGEHEGDQDDGLASLAPRRGVQPQVISRLACSVGP